MASIGNMVVNLIANTGKFQSDMKKAQGTIAEFDKRIQMVGRAAKTMATIAAIKAAADGLTAAINAARDGQDAIGAFGKSLPIVGGLATSFENLSHAIAGTAQEAERLQRAIGILDKLSALGSKMEAEGAGLMGFGDEDKALRKYIDTQKQIDEIRREAIRLNKDNPAFNIPDLSSFRRLAKEIFDLEMETIEKDKLAERNKEAIKQFEELKRRADYYANSVLTTMERQAKMQEEINMLRDKGLLTEEQARRASEMFNAGGKRTSDATSMEVERGISVKALAIGGTGDKQDRTNNLLSVISTDIKTLNQRMVMN